MQNAQKIQAQDLAGKTKLTAVTIGHGSRRIQAFVMCKHDASGQAQLTEAVLGNLSGKIGGNYRGATLTVG